MACAIGPTVLVLLAAGCASPSVASNDASPGTLSVVAAFYPVFEAAQRVGGDLVDVTNLTAPGVEPHDLELAPDQAEAIATADVVLYLGEGFQPAVQDAIGDAEGHTVDLLAGLPTVEPPERERGGPHGRSARVAGPDRCTRGWSTRCAPRSPRRRPSDASTFRSNADAFMQEIDSLADDYAAGLGRLRSVAARHEPRRVRLPGRGVRPHAGGDQRRGSRRRAERAAAGRAEDAGRGATGVTTIFTEDLVSPKVAQTLAEEAGVRTAVLHTLEGLSDEEVAAGRRLRFSDAGEPLDAAGGAWLLLNVTWRRSAARLPCSRRAGSRSPTGGRRSSSASTSASSRGSSWRSSVRTAPASRRS